MQLAREMGKTLDELEQSMSGPELILHIAEKTLTVREQERARNKAHSKRGRL